MVNKSPGKRRSVFTLSEIFLESVVLTHFLLSLLSTSVFLLRLQRKKRPVSEATRSLSFGIKYTKYKNGGLRSEAAASLGSQSLSSGGFRSQSELLSCITTAPWQARCSMQLCPGRAVIRTLHPVRASRNPCRDWSKAWFPSL